MEGTRPARVAIVGVGNVGSSFAYALLLSGLAAEIVLIDANERRAEGEAAGSYADCAGAAVTVVAAGVGQKPGETRLDLVRKNTAIFGQIVPQVAEANPTGIILVATNPVDILSYESWRLSGLPPGWLGWRQFRALGAVALDLCAVAEGRLDGYLDCSPSAHGPWDYLGGMLVCREAGALVEDAV